MAAFLTAASLPSGAQTVTNGNFASCSTSAGRVTATTIAGGTLAVDLYGVTYGAAPNPDVCPGWTFTQGTSVVYLTVVTATNASNNPPVGTKAIWLNEVKSTASTNVTSLIPGSTYTVSVDAWTDDVFADTALAVDFRGSKGTLNLPVSSVPQTISVSLCAKSTSAALVLAEAGGTTASPVFTNVKVVNANQPCAGMFTVGGTLSGLASGQTVTLLDNGGNPITLNADGTFAFPGALNDGSAYAVTVGTQPKGQVCTVTQGSGNIASANVTNVLVTCAAIPYTVGGTLTGLASGQTVTLLDNGGNPITLNADGTFTFPNTLNDGAAYAVTVGTQPKGQVCTVTRGSGNIASANVTNVLVTCTSIPPNTYTVGGSLTGLATGQTVTLLDNGGNPITLNADGTFTFPGTLNDGAAYAVTVGTQPKAQVCTVTRGSGNIASANVTNVLVTCAATPATAIAPVPVDSPWMLMLAASGVMGLAARRRRSA